MFCTNCGQQNAQGTKFCTSCGNPMPQAAEPVISPAQYQPPYVPVKKKSKAWIAIIPVVIVIAGIAAGVFFFGGRNKGGLKLGVSQTAGTVQVDPAGKVITVDVIGTGIDTMEITVPESAYDSSVDFAVSVTPIKGHRFGNDFEPVSPLITVENGGVFAAKPITVKLPLTLAPGEFALGFYYDKDTGKLEAMPFDDISDTEITLITSHFSEFFIAKTTKAALDRAGAIDTGFAPGKDDWQFTNYGSAISPGGHCAGQSLTMAWYYFERHIKENEPNLYGRFDNNGLDATDAFWKDDSNAYRFASVVQADINWNSPDYQQYLYLSNKSQENTYYAFAFAMKITGEPQFMGIYNTDISGNRLGGHAIVAYKIEDYKIFVADPNYPGQTDRLINYIPNTSAFQAYSSGINAADISSGNYISYNEVIFVGKSALVDFKAIEDYYTQMTSGTIGDDRFPTLQVLYLSNYSANPDELVWTQTDGVLANYSDSTMPADSKGQLIIAADAGYDGVLYSVFDGTTLILGPEPADADGYFYATITLADGINELGILAEVPDGPRLLFCDFMRLRVSTGDIAATPSPSPTSAQVSTNASSQISSPAAGSVIGKYDFNSRSDGQVLVNYHYIQINPDGTFEEKYQPKGDTYIGEQTGTWKVEARSGAGNFLILDYGMGITDEYTISADYKIIQSVPEAGETNPLIFTFRK